MRFLVIKILSRDNLPDRILGCEYSWKFKILQIELKERISNKDSYLYASKFPPVNIYILLINIVRSFEIHSFVRTQEIRS